VRSRLTRRLSVTASVGASFANTWQDAANPPLGTTTFQSGARTGGVALIGLSYQLSKTTGISFSASHLIVPTTSGSLQGTTTAGFSISHKINDRSNMAFGAHFAETNTGSGTSLFVGTANDFFSAYVAYSYQLARDWHTTLSYTYRQRGDSTGTAVGSTVLLSLNYNFNLLGTPSALDPVDKQRAEIRQQRAFGEVFPGLR
jgi:hypothetical protein